MHLSRPVSTLSIFALAGLLVLASLPVAAEEAEPATEEPPWSVSLGLSYLATSGNSDTETAGLAFEAERTPDPWGMTVKANFDRAEENDNLTAERYLLGIRGTRTLGERWDAFVGVSAEQDEFSGIDLRTLIEAGGVYHALTGPTHVLDVDLGLTWTDEDRLAPAPDVDSIGALAGLTYTWAISETASFSQRLIVYPNFDESDDWRLESDTAITTSLNERFALQFGYSLRHRNLPIGTNDDTDTTTKVSLVWTR
ncbi:MAG: DUF481 domain-containing protein [Acidobacteriota bacterium]